METKLIIVGALAILLTLGGIAYYKKTHKSNFLDSSETNIFDSWVRWKNSQNKVYGLTEQFARYQIYKSNFKFVNEHNSKFNNGESTFSLDLNEFADLTNEEFKAGHLGFKAAQPTNTQYLVNSVPASVDWRTSAVSPVKNQGSCGSCWAFSTIGALEGLNAIKSGKITTFSEQQLVDCAGGSYGNEGCNAGLMDQAFAYVKDHGITTEDKYAYTGKDGSCHYNEATDKAFQITGFTDVPQNSTDQLKAALSVNPVAVAIEADGLWFQFYFGGVFNHNCGTNLDHGVLAVGYGTDGTKPYWIVKNSWGGSWGEKGYIRLAITGDGPGMCGIQMSASYPNA